MKAMKKLVIIGLALIFTACTPTEKIIEKQAADATTRKIEVQDDMDAEEMALAGEQLMSVWNFMLANKAFNWSLSKDPTNKRAQFYLALLKPFMLTKGLGVRLIPYLKENGGLEDHLLTMKTLPESPLKKFLNDGSEDIRSSKDIQGLLVQVRDAWNDLRKFLIVNQNMNLVLNMNPMTFQDQVNSNMTNSCKVEQDNDHGLIVKCDYTHAFEKKVNVADLLALRQVAASYVLYLNMYTSYTVDGIDELAKLNRKNKLTEQEQIEFIQFQLPDAGKLRGDHNLSSISDLGSDFLTAARWVIQYQASLCPNDQNRYIYSPKRPGYLFDGRSFCIDDATKAEKDLMVLERALRGPISVMLTTKNGQQRTTQIDYLAFFAKPVQDLRSLAPISYNECGKVSVLKDKTINGVFPLADAEDFVTTNCRK